MAVPKLKYGIGNEASTTLGSGISNTDTSVSLTSDTNFDAKSGEGMTLMDEGESTQEFAYSDSKTGSALSTPLVNRGLEGGSAQAHSAGSTIKGILTVGMWNDLIDSIINILDQTTGAIKATVAFAAATFSGNATFNDKVTFTDERVSTIFDNENSSTEKTIDWTNGDSQKLTLTGNCTLTFTNVTAGAYLSLYLIQDGEGSRTVTWPAGTKHPGGTAPTLTTAASSVDLIGIRAFASDNYHVVASSLDIKAAA